MSSLVPYRAIEDPQALFSASEITVTDSGWVKLGGTWTRDYASSDPLGQAIDSSAGELTLPAGVWRIEISAVYTGIASGTLEWTIDRASLDKPTEQAIGDGGRYANATEQSALFSRVVHCDEVETFALFATLTNGEGSGTITLHTLQVSVEYIEHDSVVLERAWWASGFYVDAIEQYRCQASAGEPTIDGEPITLWAARSGIDLAASEDDDLTLDIAGFNNAPAIHTLGAHGGFSADSLSAAFAGNPSWTFFCQFSLGDTVSGVEHLLGFGDSADVDRQVYVGLEYGVGYIARRNLASILVGGTPTEGDHWLIARYDGASDVMQVYVDDPDTPIINGVLGGTPFDPDRVSLAVLRTGGFNISSFKNGFVRRAGLVPGKLISQGEIAQLARSVARLP